MSVTMDLDVSGVRNFLTDLERRVEAAARPAAQAGAQVLYDRVKLNVGRIGSVTGNLDRAIYQVFSQKNSKDGRAVYHVSVNMTRAPHWYLLEYGFWRRYVTYIGEDGNFYTDKTSKLATPVYQPGHAYLREAKSQMPAALEAMRKRFYQELDQRA